jgi:hypothetical protein
MSPCFLSSASIDLSTIPPEIALQENIATDHLLVLPTNQIFFGSNKEKQI